VKTKISQFTQLWAMLKYDGEKPQNIFAECSKEQIAYRHVTRDQ